MVQNVLFSAEVEQITDSNFWKLVSYYSCTLYMCLACYQIWIILTTPFLVSAKFSVWENLIHNGCKLVHTSSFRKMMYSKGHRHTSYLLREKRFHRLYWVLEFQILNLIMSKIKLFSITKIIFQYITKEIPEIFA